MEIRKIFSGLYTVMQGEFVSSGELNHSGGKGAHRETTLRKFLGDYLPRRYGVGTGTLLSSNGVLSQQCDIVIHDDFHEARLFRSEDHGIFATDAVFGVIEVKSTLSSGELEKAHRNIRAAKRAANRRTERSAAFYGCIVGYRADRTLDAVRRQLLGLNREFSAEEAYLLPNSVVVLDQGIIKPVRSGVHFLKSERNTLSHFFVGLMGDLNKIELSPVDYGKYFHFPTYIDGLSVSGHDRFLWRSKDGQPQILQLRPETIKNIYTACQKNGKKKLMGDAEFERVRAVGTLLSALVVQTGFVYNPDQRRIVSAEEVVQWESGRAVVGPRDLYPQDYILIEGEHYYLDLSALEESDFEEKEELVVGELTWEYKPM